jgi:hypothetical protein
MRRTAVAIGTCVGLVSLAVYATAWAFGDGPPERAAAAEIHYTQPVEPRVEVAPAATSTTSEIIEIAPIEPGTVERVVEASGTAVRARMLPAVVEREAPQTQVQLEMYALDRRVHELLGKWKAAKDSSDRAAIENQLRATLKGQFDARCAGHKEEIEQLQAKVKELQQQLELRREKQPEIVDFRLQQLLREAQGLGWGTEPSGGPSRAGIFIGTPAVGQGGGGMMGMGGGGGSGGQQYGFSYNASTSGGPAGGAAKVYYGSTRGIVAGMGGDIAGGPGAPPIMHPAQGALQLAVHGTGVIEQFLKGYDSSGNGKLEEDEIPVPVKFMVEGVYARLDKQLKYPLAISEVARDIEQFSDRVRAGEQDTQLRPVLDPEKKMIPVPQEPGVSAPTLRPMPRP